MTRPRSRAAIKAVSVTYGKRRVDMLTGGTGAPLVFLHGWAMPPGVYLPLLRRLSLSYTIYAPALPGFGRSDPLPRHRHTITRIAEHLTAVLDQEQVGTAHLVGHSFGGGIAARYAALDPARVSSLTLIAPVGGTTALQPPILGMPRGVFHEAMFARHRALPTAWRLARHLGPTLFTDPLSVVASGIAARTADTRAELRAVAAEGIPVTLALATRDAIVAPGELATTPNLEVVLTDGFHSGLVTNPDPYVALIRNTTARPVKAAVGE